MLLLELVGTTHFARGAILGGALPKSPEAGPFAGCFVVVEKGQFISQSFDSA